MEEKDKKIYEFSFLLSEQLIEEKMLSLFEKIKGIFKEIGAEIVKEVSPGKKSLAYPIQKQENAYFGYIHISLNPEKADEIKEKFKYEEGLLRYLFLTPPPIAREREDIEKRRDFSEKKEIKEEVKKIKKEEIKKVDETELSQKLEEIQKVS